MLILIFIIRPLYKIQLDKFDILLCFFDYREYVTQLFDRLTYFRYFFEDMAYQSRYRIVIRTFRKLQRQVAIGIVHTGSGIYHEFCFRNLLDDRCFFVILVLDLADKFLYDVFQGNHPRRSTKLVQYKSNLNTL